MQNKELGFFSRGYVNYMPFDKETSELIWHPKLSFLNIKKGKKLAGFGYTELNEYYIYDGKPLNMGMSELIKITIYCNFDYHSFPFDNQECELSLYDPINDVNWILLNEIGHLCFKGECKHSGEEGCISLPQQHGIPYTFRLKNLGSKNSLLGDDHGTYYTHPNSIATVKFLLHRNSLDLLIGSFYIPTGLFGFLSIGSYIINPDIVNLKKK